MTRYVSIALGLIACASLAYAADLKPFQEEAKTKFEKQATGLLSDVNAACGTKIAKIDSDFENFDAKNFSRSQPGSVCSSMTYAIKEACKSEPYKKAFAKKVTGLSCLTAPGTLMEMKGATLVNHMNQDKSPSTADLKAMLDK
jgi:hypothetical protein